nr:chemotaxis protein CheW [Methylobacterium sp. BTF04]
MSETTAYLLLDVAGTPCALARSALSEVLPLPRLHQPPAGGGPLAGFLNLGGVPVPVVDLARLLGLRGPAEPTGDDPYRHLVLSADRAMAFLVDRADDLVRVADASVRPVPEARTLNGCVVGEIVGPKGLVHLLSLPRLLTAEERLRLADLTRAAADRLSALADAPAA